MTELYVKCPNCKNPVDTGIDIELVECLIIENADITCSQCGTKITYSDKDIMG